MKTTKISIVQKLQEMPMWKHALIIFLGFAAWRTARALGVLAGLILLLILVGPLWFIPLPGKDTWVSNVLLILLTFIYYSPLVLVKRKIKYRGNISSWNKSWIRLIIVYGVVNLSSIAIALYLTLKTN